LNFLAAFIAELEKNLTKEQLAGAKKELDRLKSGKSAESLPSAL
jgi:hypothetical protein